MKFKGFTGIIILACYLLLLGITIYIIDYYPKPAIEEALILWMPWTLRLNFLLLLAGLLFLSCDKWPVIQNPGADDFIKSKINRIMQWLSLTKLWTIAAIFLVALLAVYTLPPQIHRLFYDEDIYANIGQNIACISRAGLSNYGSFEYGDYLGNWIQYNKEPSGWPFLISIIFQLFGVNEAHAFVLNNLLLAGSALIVFRIVYLITNGFFPGVLAALAYILIPHNLIWSNTVAAEPSAAFFGGLTALFLMEFIRSQKKLHFLLFAVTLPLACQMRPESGLIAVWSALALITFSPGMLRKRYFWMIGLVTFILMLPHIFHLYAMSGQSWGAEGAKFSGDFFLNNLRINGPYYLNQEHFPVLITILALLGCFAGRKYRLWPFIILAWFILFWGIFLFFYAGSYRYGTDVRFALVTFMPLAVLAGLGGDVLRNWLTALAKAVNRNKMDGSDKEARSGGGGNIWSRYTGTLIFLVLIFSWLPFLPMIRTVGQEAWSARFDHRFAREFSEKMPERSIVLTHNPTMFILWGKNAIQAHVALTNPVLVEQLMERYPGQVYFHLNFWCNTLNDPNKKLCGDIMGSYSMDEIAVAQEQNYRYGLYRMHPKDGTKRNLR